jgi:aminoglycoside phosphotransferase
VKVARLADDTTLDHEAAILGVLRPTLGTSGRCPSLIDAPGLPTEIGGGTWPVLVESGISGSALDPAAVRRDRDGAVRAIASFLAELPVRPAADRATPIATRLADALTNIRAVADPDLRDLAERTARVVGRIGDAPLPRVLEHGDPAHPNLLVLADGTVGAVDWERGESDGLPLHDLSIALAYAAAADRRATDATAQARAFRDAMTGPDPWAAAALDRDAIRVGVDTALRPALVVAAFARTVAWLADHLEAGPSGPDDGVLRGADGAPDTDPGGRDAGSWLVADRSVALWRVALELAERA